MKKWYLIPAVLAITLLVVSCAPTAPPPEISDDAKNMAISVIKDYPLVRDAAIIQDGRKLSLVIIVSYATSEEHAKELGDNFVRLVKTFSEDEPPKKEIGEGIYDYLIGVYYPNEEEVALGAKVSFSPHITW